MLLEGLVLGVTALSQITDQIALQVIQLPVGAINQIILQPGSHQLSQVVNGRNLDAVVRADGLPLYGHLYLIAFNILAMSSVEQIGVSATASGRTTATVEEHHFHTGIAGHGSDGFLGGVDRPVGHHVAAVLGAVRETQHHGLALPSLSQMRLIVLILIQTGHRLATLAQVVDSFKQRHNIHIDVVITPAAQAEQCQHPGHIHRTAAVADDIAVRTALAIAGLNLTDHPKRFNGIAYHRIIELASIHRFAHTALNQRINLRLLGQRRKPGRQHIRDCVDDAVKGSGEHPTVLTNIDTGKMETEQCQFAPERAQRLQVHGLITLDD